MPNLSQTLHDTENAPTSSEAQLQKLIEVISRSQLAFRELIDHLDQAVFTLTLEGEIRVANARFSEIAGAPFAELIGHNISEFVSAPDFAAVEKSLPEFLRAGSWSGRIPVQLRRCGEIRYFDCYLQAVDGAGRAGAVSGWARDVTEIRRSEQRSMELFESLHEGVLFTAPDGQILDVNPAFVRMLGYSTKEELLGRNVAEIYADPSRRAELVSEIEAAGSVRDVEVAFRRKHGQEIHCMSSALGVRNEAGELIRIQGTLRDVTEQRIMERELHKEREFGRRLVACFPDVIALLDTESRFTYVSESVRSVLGHPPAYFIGKRLGANSDAEDRAKLEAMMASLLTGGAIRGQVEVHTQHANGSRRSFRISAAPLLDEKGKISGIVTSGRDVTESNAQDRQVADREKFTAMGQMLAGAAHELNNPLTAILGVSDLLSETSHDEVTKRQASLILKQARRAAGIVQNLLAFSRPRSAGLLPLRIEEVLQHIVLAQRQAFEEKGIDVKLEAASELPAVDGDRKLLTQVFSNIILNAEQAILSAKSSGTISIGVTSQAGRVCVAFGNDGPPIAPENFGKLFDPFFTTKRPGGGSGLGLTICLAIVKDHGGSIDVQSPADGGAVFRIYLPAANYAGAANRPSGFGKDLGKAGIAPAAAEAGGNARGADSRIIPALQGRSVVVVDDEESILEIMQEGLATRGLRIAAFQHAEEALVYIEKNPCEAVLCDYNIPGMKGSELFGSVRAALGDRSPQFIFMTGELVESSAIVELRDRGALTLQKPFSIPAVTDILLSIFQATN